MNTLQNHADDHESLSDIQQEFRELETSIHWLTQQQETEEFASEPQCDDAKNTILQWSVPPLENQHVGPYQVEKLLGKGGMGSVYLAQHGELKQKVALKVLLEDRKLDENCVKRFRGEISAIGQLNHPNIVGAQHAGECDAGLFLAMELVDGIDLASLLAETGPLETTVVAEIGRQAALGLHYAHQQGVVHRDIKPSNLMLNNEGVLKILDLGLARLLAARDGRQDGLTQIGQAVGTLDFMAPEQFEAARDTDGRADIYALGATLYMLLTGVAPFDRRHYANSSAQISAILNSELPSVRSMRVASDDRLDQLVERMLRKDPQQRPATMEGVVAELTEIATTLPTVSQWSQLGVTNHREAPAAKHATGPRPVAAGRGLVLPAVLLAIAASVLTTIVIKINQGGKEHVFELGAGDSLAINASEAVAESERSVVAQWVLDRGGYITYSRDTGPREVRSIDEIPKEEFEIEAVVFTGVQELTAEDLSSLGTLPKLGGLVLDGTSVGNQIVRVLPQFPRLRALYLCDTKVTGAILASVGQRKTLRGIALDRTQIQDHDVAGLVKNAHLEKVLLNDTGITDEALRHLAQLRVLSHLELAGTKISDAGLEALRQLTSLKVLDLRRTECSQDAVDRFGMSNPSCEIRF